MCEENLPAIAGGVVINAHDIADQTWMKGQELFTKKLREDPPADPGYKRLDLGPQYIRFLSAMTRDDRHQYWLDTVTHLPPLSVSAQLSQDPMFDDFLENRLRKLQSEPERD